MFNRNIFAINVLFNTDWYTDTGNITQEMAPGNTTGSEVVKHMIMVKNLQHAHGLMQDWDVAIILLILFVEIVCYLELSYWIKRQWHFN